MSAPLLTVADAGGRDVEPVRPADPRWTRPALAALLAVTALFWSIGLSRMGWANAFYSAAVQAGTKSCKAFLYGSSDAGNSITVDKPPASLWPMEISARIFGVNTWSILLPEVLLGLGSVALVYVIVKRRFGPTAGLIAGAVLAVTPVATLMFRYNNPDAMLVFVMIAAVWALMRAVTDGRTRWLVLCGALIGFGFLTKQLQVMLVVPGLALAYLIAGPVRLGVRILQLGAGLLAMFAAAGWWVLLVSLTPAADRPYIGGSTDNSFLNLTFGYNGVSRLLGHHGGGPGGFAAPGGFGGPGGPGHGFAFGTQAGLTRLFSGEAGGQISWLLPAALILLAVGIVLCGRGSRTDERRAQYLVWGGWLIGGGAVLSFMSGMFHDYYTVAVAPAVAALIGIGVTQLWARRASRWVGLTLAGTVALTAAWSWVLLGRSPAFLPPLRWAVLVGGVLAALAIACLLRSNRFGGRIAWWTAAVAAVAALAGPLAYSIQTVSTPHNGGIVTAGPAVAGGRSPAMAPGGPGGPGAVGPGGGAPWPAGGPPGMGDEKPSDRIVQMLSQDAGAYTWVAATTGANGAAGYQLATGDAVMPIGGFMGGDPSPTLAQFQRYVADGRIHYYIEGHRPGMPRGGDAAGASQKQRPDTEGDRIDAWVKQSFIATTIDGVTYYDLTAPVK